MESLPDVIAPEHPAMERDEDHQAVRDAIFALPQAQREIVLLRFADELNHTQIAERLEIHPVTVGRQLEKAMAKMRTTLESDLEESVRDLKPSRRAIARTAAMAGAVAKLSSPTRGDDKNRGANGAAASGNISFERSVSHGSDRKIEAGGHCHNPPDSGYWHRDH